MDTGEREQLEEQARWEEQNNMEQAKRYTGPTETERKNLWTWRPGKCRNRERQCWRKELVLYVGWTSWPGAWEGVSKKTWCSTKKERPLETTKVVRKRQSRWYCNWEEQSEKSIFIGDCFPYKTRRKLFLNPAFVFQSELLWKPVAKCPISFYMGR